MTRNRSVIRRAVHTFVILVSLGTAAPAVAGMSEGLRALFAGDHATARAEFEPLAEDGVLRAAFWLGRMEAEGRGGDPNPARGRDLIHHAAEGGDIKAQGFLGRAARDGTLGPADPAAAARWLRRAAAGGDAAAARALAALYAGGMADDADAVARRLKQKAAEGDPEAQWLLGELHAIGQGVAWDFDASRGWFELAAAQGHVIAMARRGDYIYEGLGGTPDPAAATEWYGKAAAAGNGHGLFGLGRAYLGGHDVDRDAGTAFNLFVLADAVGHIRAKNGIVEIGPDDLSADIASGAWRSKAPVPISQLLSRYGIDADWLAEAEQRLRAFFETALEDDKDPAARLFEEIEADEAAPDLATPLPD
jgi:TPR repeat protein